MKLEKVEKINPDVADAIFKLLEQKKDELTINGKHKGKVRVSGFGNKFPVVFVQGTDIEHEFASATLWNVLNGSLNFLT